MSIVGWIVVGVIAGFLAKYVLPREAPGSVVVDLVVGIVGALFGGRMFSLFFHSGAPDINLYSVVVAFIGAGMLTFVVRMVPGGSIAL